MVPGCRACSMDAISSDIQDNPRIPWDIWDMGPGCKAGSMDGTSRDVLANPMTPKESWDVGPCCITSSNLGLHHMSLVIPRHLGTFGTWDLSVNLKAWMGKILGCP